RVGAGGIMLPNHAPLLIAEQFGTLEALFPGRIDLGLGRAPGSDPATERLLRRTPASAEAFPNDVAELIALLEPSLPGQILRAVPGEGTRVPIWILGSSLFGAQLAAALGLPFAFASHFAPAHLMNALQVYRSRFRPSRHLATPYVMLGINITAADTDEEARWLFTSTEQSFANLRRGTTTPVPPPKAGFRETLSEAEQWQLDEIFSAAIVGGPDTVRRRIREFLDRTNADELIVAAQTFDHRARLRSYEIVADARD